MPMFLGKHEIDLDAPAHSGFQAHRPPDFSKMMKHKISLHGKRYQLFYNLLRGHLERHGFHTHTFYEVAHEDRICLSTVPPEAQRQLSELLFQYLVQDDVLPADDMRIKSLTDMYEANLDGFGLLKGIIQPELEKAKGNNVPPVLSDFGSVPSYIGSLVKFYDGEAASDRSYSDREKSLTVIGEIQRSDLPTSVKDAATAIRRKVEEDKDTILPKYSMMQLCNTIQTDYHISPDDMMTADIQGTAHQLDGQANAMDGRPNDDRRRGRRNGGRRDSAPRGSSTRPKRQLAEEMKQFRTFEPCQCGGCGGFGHPKRGCSFLARVLFCMEMISKMSSKEKKIIMETWHKANSKTALEANAKRLEAAEGGDPLPYDYLSDEGIVCHLIQYELEESGVQEMSDF